MKLKSVHIKLNIFFKRISQKLYPLSHLASLHSKIVDIQRIIYNISFLSVGKSDALKDDLEVHIKAVNKVTVKFKL